MKYGEIWLINLDPTIGAEIRKTRPAIIVSADSIGILPLKVIVPITDWKDQYEIADWMVRITPSESNGLRKVSAADAFQVRSVSERRMIERIGTMGNSELILIREAIANVFAL